MSEIMKVKVTMSIIVDIEGVTDKSDFLKAIADTLSEDPMWLLDNTYDGDNITIESVEELLL